MELRDGERVSRDALVRRRDHLAERLQRWETGDPNRTRGEVSALSWALRLVDACEREGLLSDLRELGYRV